MRFYHIQTTFAILNSIITVQCSVYKNLYGINLRCRCWQIFCLPGVCSTKCWLGSLWNNLWLYLPQTQDKVQWRHNLRFLFWWLARVWPMALQNLTTKTYLFNSFTVGWIYVTQRHRRIFRRLPFKRERENTKITATCCAVEFFTIRSRLPMNGVTWSRVDQSDIFRLWRPMPRFVFKFMRISVDDANIENDIWRR